MSMDIADQQIEKWQNLLEEERADQEWQKDHERVNAKRHITQQEITKFLQRFSSGEIDLEEFRSTYDKKTKTQWVGFGLKGMSGAMFLNMLVKYVPDSQSLGEEFKRVLPVPKDSQEGQERMSSFYTYLNEILKSANVTKRQIQPMRLPFFVSSWWHVQDVETWPVFYVSARQILESDGIYASMSHPVQDYFRFRECFCSLASILELDSWAFEHLCSWRFEKISSAKEKNKHGDTGTLPRPNFPEGEDTGDGSVATHSQIQLLLARMGKKLGCSVWVAANDHNKEFNGQQLGELSLETLPSLGVDKEAQKAIRMIDVLWLKGGKQVAAAFEIEHTTSIYSGLLRMSDLVASSPNINFPLYIVTPEKRLDKVRFELSRPTFQTLELHKRCGFFSYESLEREADSIMSWASDPVIIEKLASKVGDSTDEEGA